MTVSGQELYQKAQALEVNTEEDLHLGDAILSAIKAKVSLWKPGLDKKCSEADGLHRFLTALRTKALAPFVSAEAEVKRKMGAFEFNRQEQVRKDNERAEAKARKEAQEKRDREIAEAKKNRDKEMVKELQAAPLPMPEIKTPPPAEPPKMANTSMRDGGYDYRIADESLLPRKYLMPNDSKIKGVVKALGKECDIPGIVVFPKPPIVVSR